MSNFKCRVLDKAETKFFDYARHKLGRNLHKYEPLVHTFLSLQPYESLTVEATEEEAKAIKTGFYLWSKRNNIDLKFSTKYTYYKNNGVVVNVCWITKLSNITTVPKSTT